MAAPPTCLIIDDDPFSGMVISQMLVQAGINVAVKEECTEALELLKATPTIETVPPPKTSHTRRLCRTHASLHAAADTGLGTRGGDWPHVAEANQRRGAQLPSSVVVAALVCELVRPPYKRHPPTVLRLPA